MDNNTKIKIIRSSDSSSIQIGAGADYWLLSGGLEGFGSISNTLGFTDHAITDGGVFTSEHLSNTDRTIKFCYLHDDTNGVARRNLLRFFNVKDDFKVYVTYGDRTVWQTGKLYKLNAGMTSSTKDRLDVAVTFMFANPYWNSASDFGENIASLRGCTAFPYLCRADRGVTGGVFNFAQQVILYNDGDVSTYGKIVLTASGGYVDNPTITINGEYVRVIDRMEDGDKITMDFTAFPPTVRKNGVNFIGHCDRTSAFDGMIIERGDNLIEYDADNGSSHLNVTIYYYKQYGAV